MSLRWAHSHFVVFVMWRLFYEGDSEHYDTRKKDVAGGVDEASDRAGVLCTAACMFSMGGCLVPVGLGFFCN